jgi:osmotically-inducible protein OsmY
MAIADDYQIIPVSMGGMGASVPVAGKGDRADILDKINPDKVAEEIRQRLLGKEKINSAWVEVAALQDRKLSATGAWEISNLMLGCGSMSVAISKWTDGEIKKRALGIAKTAQYMLVGNWLLYGLKNTAQQHTIHQIVFTNAYTVLKQAQDASIQELIKGTVQENRNIQSEPRREGRLKRMLGLGGN